MLLVGGGRVIDGQLSVGGLFEFTVYLGMMMFPLEILGWTLATMPRALAAAKRVEEIFAAAPEPDAGKDLALTGRIEARSLSFRYPGAEQDALRDVSFSLEPGQKLGLLGPVGSGKSTLLALLLRFYDPPRGTLFLDGHDVLDLAPQAVRRLFAYAPQEPFLFSDTLLDNIRFGCESDRDEAQVLRAVEQAALDQDLPQLAEGLQTVVGERGVTLSGGQRQRVSLARALLSERPALLLDDTLSAVDPHTERRIVRGIAAARTGRTTVVAGHRVSAIADADLVLVLEGGTITERGRHQELLSAGRLYAAAWRRQSEAAALEGEGQP